MSRLGAELTLDQIDSWFKHGKTVAPVPTAPRSKSGGRVLDEKTGKPIEFVKDDPYVPHYKRCGRGGHLSQLAYAKEIKQQEEEQLRASSQVSAPRMHHMNASLRGGRSAGVPSHTTMDDLETISMASGMTGATEPVKMPEDTDPERTHEIYANYKFKTYPSKLPITAHQEQIVATIESNQVTVIEGSTGSGKTTQVPQYILDHYARENRYCNIVVTQPRRIAAMSVARRVCSERDWNMPVLCGYQVGMEKENNEDTRILYCTTGVLLNKLINKKNMLDYTHVIMDEVHERDEDSDFCLLVVRKLLRSNSRHVKVVLMSATIDSRLFAEYFSVPVLNKMEPAPTVQVGGRIYDVEEYYAEDLRKLGPLPHLESDHAHIPEESYNLATQLIAQLDELELKKEGALESGKRFASSRGTVLVFLPGLQEITDLDNQLYEIKDNCRLTLLHLHSKIMLDEQYSVFKPPEHGHRKVILSTNIAESSITVPDIKYVIDFCLTKYNMCDPDTNYTRLVLDWTSKASSTQRKGRAGRVSDGRVYRMVTREFWNEGIPDYGKPEMERCPLEALILKVKVLDLGSPAYILGLALSPPRLDDIEKTILLLREVGALAPPEEGKDVDCTDGELTFIGRVLQALPLDIRLGKLIVLGHVFGLLEECLIIAACMSIKSIFRKPFRQPLDAFRSKLEWSQTHMSDPIAAFNAFRLWSDYKRDGCFPNNQNQRTWANNTFIQIRHLREAEELKNELENRLKKFNICLPHFGPNRREQPLRNEQMHRLLKMVLCGAFYPNYFTRGEMDEGETARTLSNHDPFRTVLVKGLPANQGGLYKSQVEQHFKPLVRDGTRMNIFFEETKAFIEFERPRKTAQVGQQLKNLIQVVLAVKMRELRIPMQIQLMDVEDAREKMSQLSVLQDSSRIKARLRTNRIKAVSDKKRMSLDGEDGENLPRQEQLPSGKITTIEIYITEVLECGHFWGHYADPETFAKLRDLLKDINMYNGANLKVLTGAGLEYGGYCLAPYDGDYYRARIERIDMSTNTVEVFFLDYGNTATVEIPQLCVMEPQHLRLPFQSLEFYLSHIRASTMKCPDGRWTREANEFFMSHVADQKIYARIYSIVKGVLRVELIKKMADGRTEVNINELLKTQRYADNADEPYASEQSNKKRDMEAMAEEEVLEDEEDWLELSMDGLQKGGRSRRGERVRLTGPWAGYEMQFYSMTQIGRLRAARIERDSVNSVALDEEPQDKHPRMMVAGMVGLNPSGSTMQARDTTIMPNIHGLTALAALLFTPMAELRTDPKMRRYTGALCGLGYDFTHNGPALPDHDMEVVFDVVIDRQDIAMINGVRMAINMGLRSDPATGKQVMWDRGAIGKLQYNARKKLEELLDRPRIDKEWEHFARPCQWNQVNPDNYLPHGLEGTEADCAYLLALHRAVALNEEPPPVRPQIEQYPNRPTSMFGPHGMGQHRMGQQTMGQHGQHTMGFQGIGHQRPDNHTPGILSAGVPDHLKSARVYGYGQLGGGHPPEEYPRSHPPMKPVPRGPQPKYSDLTEHLSWLHQKSIGPRVVESIMCDFCAHRLGSTLELLVHMKTPKHKKNVEIMLQH